MSNKTYSEPLGAFHIDAKWFNYAPLQQIYSYISVAYCPALLNLILK